MACLPPIQILTLHQRHRLWGFAPWAVAWDRQIIALFHKVLDFS
jgi:hypothetical protein